MYVNGRNPTDEASSFLEIFTKIVKNLNFAIWKKVVANFVGVPQPNRDRKSAVFVAAKQQLYILENHSLTHSLTDSLTHSLTHFLTFS